MQFLRYLCVGVLSNGIAYGVYIVITQFGLAPVTGMSITYLIAAMASFAANKGWTFRSSARISRSALRYILCQLLGYGTNLIFLSWLYFVLGVPHQVAQLVGIGLVAVELFLLNRYYVFN
jgi:putative flippase GtrA